MMTEKSMDAPAGLGRSDPWEFARYALKSNRAELIARFNHLVGAPSYTVAVLQAEFINDRMYPEEMLAFVKEYTRIIATASRANLAPDEPA